MPKTPPKPLRWKRRLALRTGPNGGIGPCTLRGPTAPYRPSREITRSVMRRQARIAAGRYPW